MLGELYYSWTKKEPIEIDLYDLVSFHIDEAIRLGRTGEEYIKIMKDVDVIEQGMEDMIYDTK